MSLDEDAEAPGTRQSIRKGGRLKRLFILAFLTLVLLGAFLALAPTLLSGKVRTEILAAAGDALNGDLLLDDLALGWTSGARLEGLAVRNAGGDEVLRVASISVGPDLSDLLTKGKVRGTVRIRGVTLNAHIDEEGRLDLEDLLKPSPEPEKPSTELPDLDVRVLLSNVTLKVWDASRPADAPSVLRIERAEARLATGRPLVWKVDLFHGIGASGEVDLLEGRELRKGGDMGVRARISVSGVDLMTLLAELLPGIQAPAGRLDLDQEIRIAAGVTSIRGPIRIAGLRARAPGGEVSGDVAASIDLELAAGRQATGSARLDLRGGSVRLDRGPAKDIALGNLTLDTRLAADGGLDVRTLKLAGGVLDVDGTGRLLLAGGTPTGTLDLRVDGDLEPLRALVEGLPDLTGRLHSEVRWRSESAGAMAVSGTTEIRNLVVPLPDADLPPVREELLRVRHDLALSAGSLSFENVSITSGLCRLRCEGSLRLDDTGERAEGRLAMNGELDLTRLSALLGDAAPVRGGGRLRFDARADGAGSRVTFDATLEGEGVELAGLLPEAKPLTLGKPSLRLEGVHDLHSGRLDLPRAEFASDLVSGTLSLDARLPSGVEELSLRAAGRLEPNLDALLALLAPRESLPGMGRGSLDLDLEVLGRKADLKTAVLKAGGLTLEASGWVQADADGGLPSGVVDYKLSGDPGRVPEALQKRLPVSAAGPLLLAGQARLGAPLLVTAKLTSSSLVLSDGPFAGEPLRLEGLDVGGRVSLDSAGGTLSVEGLRLAVKRPALAATGNLVAAGLGGEEPPRISGTFGGRADLSALPAGLLGLREGASLSGETTFSLKGAYADQVMLETLNASAPKMRIAFEDGGLFVGRVEIQGRLPRDRNLFLRVSSRQVRIRVPGAQGPPTKAGDTNVRVSGRLDETWRLHPREIVVRGPGVDLSATGSEEGAGERLTLQARLLSKEFTDTWLKLFAPGIHLLGDGRANVALVFPHDRSGGGFEHLSGTIDLSAKGLSIPGLEMRDLVVKGKAADGRLEITEAAARVNEGQASLRGTYAMEGQRPAWQVVSRARDIDIREELQPAIARVIPIFAGLGVQITARISMDLDLRGQGIELADLENTLEGGGLVSLSRGRMRGGPLLTMIGTLAGVSPNMDFKPFQTRFRVVKGRILQDDILISSDAMDIRVSGSSTVAGRLDYTVGFKIKGRRTAQWQRVLSFVDKDGFLPLGLKGSVTDPKVTPPDLKRLITNPLGGLLGGGLKGLLDRKKKKKDGK